MPTRLVRALVPVSLVLAASVPFVPSDGTATRFARAEPVAVITGRVTDSATHQPLATTQVSVRETTLGVQTDARGYYRLNVPVDSIKGRDIVMLVRRIGYAPSTRALHITTGTRTENFALIASTTQLENIVVTGTAATTANAAVAKSIVSTKALGATIAPAPATAASPRRAKEMAELPRQGPGQHRGLQRHLRESVPDTAFAPRSTFSIDVDHASYSNVRRFLRRGSSHRATPYGWKS